jgi:hypothetical protein
MDQLLLIVANVRNRKLILLFITNSLSSYKIADKTKLASKWKRPLQMITKKK